MQLKQTWFSFAALRRSSIPSAANWRHWSGQWDDPLQYQHLYHFLLESSTLKRKTDLWLELDLNGAVARIRDFISTVIHFISPSKVALFPCRSRSRDQTFRSSAHIFCSMTHNIWLLSMSFWLPTSFRVLKLRLTKWTKSQNRASSPICRALNSVNYILSYRVRDEPWISVNRVQIVPRCVVVGTDPFN